MEISSIGAAGGMLGMQRDVALFRVSIFRPRVPHVNLVVL
jgi:hypothetical protein